MSLEFVVVIITTIDPIANDCIHSYSQADHLMIQIQRCSTTQHTRSSSDALSRVDRIIHFVRQPTRTLNYLSLREPEDRCPTLTGDMYRGILDRLLVSIPWPCMMTGEQELIRMIIQMISKAWYVLEEQMAAPSHLAHVDNIAFLGIAESVMIAYETVKCLILL